MNLLESLWRLRYLQKNLEFEAALAQNRDSLDDSTVKLMDASLLRFKNRLSESDQTLEEIPAESQGVHYFLQKSLNLLSQSNYLGALDLFMQARPLAKTSLEKILTEANILVCYENIHLPLKGQLTRVNSLLESEKDREIVNFISNVTSAMQLREDFQNAHLETLLEPPTQTPFQKAALHLFYLNLPYIKQNSALQGRYAEKIFENTNLPYRSYRIQTLFHDTHFEILQKIETKERIDRLYLWTWKWLQDPTVISEGSLKDLIDELASTTQPGALTHEDKGMLKNALGWIKIFSPALAKSHAFKQLLPLAPKEQVSHSPLFDFEARLLKVLKNQDQAESRRLKNDPVYNHPLACWKDVLSHLKRRLRQKPSRFQVMVDLNSHQIAWDGKVLVSQPLSLCLALFKDKAVVSFSELLESAFGIPEYDSGIHSAKINNLLQRAKKIFGSRLQIITRQHNVYILNANRDFIEIHKQSLTSQTPDIENSNHIKQYFNLKSVLRGTKSSRKEIQSLLKTTKATTNRLLNLWLEEGRVERVGHGRSSYYLIK